MSFIERPARSSAAERFSEPADPRAGRAAERRERNRRIISRRQDVALGVLGALVALVLGPGLAVVVIGALLVLIACGVSFALGRLRRRRRRR